MYLIWLYGKVRGILLIRVGESESEGLSLNSKGGQVMNAVQEIKIEGASEEITGWKRYISFTYEGNQYEATLYWDSEGYELIFKSENGVAYKGFYDMPQWAENWDEENESGLILSHYLDDLTHDLEGVK
jgi:hypothetical protein